MTHSKVVAITGGSSGIGLAMSTLFLKQGHNVAILARSLEHLDLLTKTNSERLLVCSGDVCKPDDLHDFYRKCSDRWGGVDTVIANAGIALAENIATVSETSYANTMDTNVKGVFFTVQKALPFLNTNASILLVSSIQAQRGAGVWSIYGASKAAVSFAEELSPQGIRVNTISPGVTETPIFNKFGFSNADMTSILEQVCANTPLRRIAQPAEIAQAASFLISEDASFITGADLQVDGGLAQI